MYVFLDESGDAGFKLEQGSSTFFIIVLIIFDSAEDAQQTERKIRDLRVSLKVRDNFEFKFNKMDDFRRLQFLEAVRGCPFRIRAMVVDKRLIHSDTLRKDKNKFYNYFVEKVLEHNQGRIRQAKLRVDGSGGREFKNAFKTYLRQRLPSGTLADCKFKDSASDSLIQLADMVAGALRRHYDPNKLEGQFRDRIAHKLEDEWKFR